MGTKILDGTRQEAIEEAALLLKQGCLVAFPTDTLYGLGADAHNAEAIERLYQVKERPRDKGIPVLLADKEALAGVVTEVSPIASELIERFWPGPLTLILPRSPGLPANISPDDNVAVRIPDNDAAKSLIHAAGGAVATSSANKSGMPPPGNAQEVLRALQGEARALVYDHQPKSGQASTVIDCTVNPPEILRKGSISEEQLKAIMDASS